MSGISSIYSNKQRITGISSGMDTDTIVKNLLWSHQSKVDKQSQAKTRLQWYQESLTAVSDKLKSFRNNFLSVLGTSSMVKSSTYKSMTVKTTDTSGSAAITADTTATTGSFTIDEIVQLAKNAGTASAQKISANGEAISDSNLTTLGELKFAQDLGFENGQIAFKINGKQFNFKSTDTLQSMVNTINSDKDANVNFTYSRLSDKFSISTKSGGAASSLTIENVTGNAFGANGAFGINSGSFNNGQNAIAVINGETIERSSNTFSADGITYQLNKVTDIPATYTVEQDVDSTLSKVKDFVSAYNKLVADLNTSYTEKKNKDYAPLTDEQKASMTADQITQWETKAKAGTLLNNRDLYSLMSDMRAAVYSPSGGTGSSLADIGISMGNYFTSDRNNLVIDEEALTAAIKKDPDAVMNMFAAQGTGMSDQAGFATKITNRVNSYINTTISDDIANTSSKINSYDSKITQLQDKLIEMQEKYYKQYSALETFMSNMNSQSTWLSQQLSSLTGGK